MKKSFKIYCLGLLLSLFSHIDAHAGQLINAPYQICFTPGGHCTNLIIETLNKAHKSIYIQAYSFTSFPIAQALVRAKNRGVVVKIILDKSHIKKNQFTLLPFFQKNNIEVWIDYKPAIAHNKLMIIDNNIVITGSFNFTKAAEEKNAENLLVISNDELAKAYLNNWFARQNQSHHIRPASNDMDFPNEKQDDFVRFHHSYKKILNKLNAFWE